MNIEQRGDELICSSKDIYPKADVSWSLRPPPVVEPKTSVSESEKGLYSIFSSVRLSHKPPEEHSCNISTEHSWSSATYRLQSEYYHQFKSLNQSELSLSQRRTRDNEWRKRKLSEEYSVLAAVVGQ